MNNRNKAVTLVLAYAIILVLLSRSEATVTYVRAAEPEPVEVFIAEVTAYTSSEEETDDTPLLTASGELVGPGTIACPSRFAFGTLVRIEKRLYTCRDRMNARYRSTNHFDIWVETKQEAYAWGRRKVQVSIFPSDIHTLAEK